MPMPTSWWRLAHDGTYVSRSGGARSERGLSVSRDLPNWTSTPDSTLRTFVSTATCERGEKVLRMGDSRGSLAAQVLGGWFVRQHTISVHTRFPKSVGSHPHESQRRSRMESPNPPTSVRAAVTG